MVKQSDVVRGSLAPIFQPKSIAVVGASPTSEWGRLALENLRTVGFEGHVVAVNPKYNDILGFSCYPSLSQIPFVPNAAIVSVNRERVVQVIEEAAHLGVGGVVIFAIGFAEAGPEWRQAQEHFASVAREAGMAVIGPNCQGTINFVQPCAMYMGPVQKYEAGSVGLFSQSGAITTALTNNKRGVRWSHVASCGNEAVSGAPDILGYYVDDPHVKVICGFIETIRNAEQFFYECDRARDAGKPVIILKAGRTEAGQKAATAHSGALAAPFRMYEELFRRHGVVRVDTCEELLETAIAFSTSRRPRGGRVASVTGSGGEIELILDELGKYPTVLSAPQFEPGTKQFLRGILPEFLATSNPLDYWGVADYVTAYAQILEALVQDVNVDIVVGVSDPNAGPTGAANQEDQSYLDIQGLASRTDKLIALVTPLDGEPQAELVEQMLAHDIPVLSGFLEGFKALQNLVTWHGSAPRPLGHTKIAMTALEGILDQSGHRPITGLAAPNLLTAAGIGTAPSTVTSSEDEATRAANQFGYPVVVKAGDDGAFHKTDTGGVHLNLGSQEDVRQAVQRLSASGSTRFLIQKQVEQGIEIICGLKSDPGLGTFVIVGLGGIWTEILKDVSMRPVGLREGEAAEMIAELKGSLLLTGARGSRAVDMTALIDVIEKLDAIGQALGPRIEALDINPLIVNDRGVVAVDALLIPV